MAKGRLNRMKPGRLHVQIVTSDVERHKPNRLHHHNVFEMLYILEGSTHIRIRRREYVGSVGDLLIYYPGEDHEERIQKGRWTVFVLRFPQPRLAGGVSFPDRRRTPPVVSLPWPERFQKLFEVMLMDSKVVDAWTDIMSKAYLVQFAVLLRRALREVLSGSSRPAGGERSQRIEKAIDMIHDSLTGDLSLKELARRAFMSESSFSHVFKDLTGVPPRRYAIQTRIARAKELLETTDLSVKEIAAELGYDDPHYFSRQFRKLAGMPPSVFRDKAGDRKPR